MTEKTPSPTKESSKGPTRTSAGAAGVASGTALAAFANSLPPESRLRFWLTLIAPSLSIVSSVIWMWLLATVANAIRDFRIHRITQRAERALQNILSDNSTSHETRSSAKAALEKLRRGLVQRDLDELESLMERVTLDDVRRHSHELSGTPDSHAAPSGFQESDR
jgi:hypothetical protein